MKYAAVHELLEKKIPTAEPHNPHSSANRGMINLACRLTPSRTLKSNSPSPQRSWQWFPNHGSTVCGSECCRTRWACHYSPHWSIGCVPSCWSGQPLQRHLETGTSFSLSLMVHILHLPVIIFLSLSSLQQHHNQSNLLPHNT